MFAFLNLPNKKGFTLIELIIVIVVLGILAVVVFPNFVNLSEDAKISSFKAVLGALNTANKTNKVLQLSLGKGVAIPTTMTCLAATNALLDGGLPDGLSAFKWPSGGTLGGTPGEDHLCALYTLPGYTPPFQGAGFMVTSTE